VRVVANESNTELLMVHRKDINRLFSPGDRAKLADHMSTVQFPTTNDVIREVEIHRSIQKIKKNCFMNGCDTNFTIGRVKEGIIADHKILKRL